MFKNFNIGINNMNSEKILFSCLSLLLTLYFIKKRINLDKQNKESEKFKKEEKENKELKVNEDNIKKEDIEKNKENKKDKEVEKEVGQNENIILSDSDESFDFEFCEEIEIDDDKKILYLKDNEYTPEYVESYKDGLFSFNIIYKNFMKMFK